MKEVHPLFRHPAVLGVILVLYAFFALCSTLCLEYPGVFILFILCSILYFVNHTYKYILNLIFPELYN